MTRHTKQWGIDLAYSLDKYLQTCADNKIIKIVGTDQISSGAGFGSRDMQFGFATQEEATAARARLIEHFGDGYFEYLEVTENARECSICHEHIPTHKPVVCLWIDFDGDAVDVDATICAKCAIRLNLVTEEDING